MLALVLITVFAWAWLIGGAGTLMVPQTSLLPPLAEHPAPQAMPMPDMVRTGRSSSAPSAWTPLRFGLTLTMWWTMMIAMMLPSAAPTILLYSKASSHGDAKTQPSTAGFLIGYLFAWGAFSLLATGVHAGLERTGYISEMLLASRSRWLSAGILFSAGIYQLTPIKNMCLRHCRNPGQFLSRHYRPGRSGALQMGLIHGVYCIGCCGLLMLLLFIGGVMNLAWIALLTLMVAAEKLLPHGRLVSLVTGAASILGALVFLLR
ncbi:MAG: DUF2182 domain-containing protein [Novosphingobium sp.]